MEIKWKYLSGYRGDKSVARQYASEYKGHAIYSVIYALKDSNGEWGTGKRMYYLPGDKKNYDTLEELLRAVDEL